jgi:hypothetical protein
MASAVLLIMLQIGISTKLPGVVETVKSKLDSGADAD